MRLLLMLAHSIEEYDQVRLLTELGHDVFSIGAYIDPSNPLDDMRPALPDAAHHPELKAVIDAQPVTDDKPDRLWNAKDELPQEVIDWADVIICHHVESRWLWPQWKRIRHKRVIWRTVGQSLHVNEWEAQPFVKDGCEVVRYSPKERGIPNYAGESALIRFYKDEDEYKGWNGTQSRVLAIHQNPLTRGDGGSWVNLAWLREATDGLPVRWVGPGTEPLGGTGKISPKALRDEMCEARAAIYTGTQPASYTLALIEQMMTGLPVVSIGPSHMKVAPYGSALYEGHAIAPLFSDRAVEARSMLVEMLNNLDAARPIAQVSRQRALALFSKDRALKAWEGWLMDKTPPDSDPEELADVSEALSTWPAKI